MIIYIIILLLYFGSVIHRETIELQNQHGNFFPVRLILLTRWNETLLMIWTIFREATQLGLLYGLGAPLKCLPQFEIHVFTQV